jgi:hypothetical protein
MKQLILSLLGVWLCIFPIAAQNGSQTAPFTSLSQARTVTTSGNYYFLLDGVAFRTYVDAAGFIQIAYDSSSVNTKEALPLLTDLPRNTYGMLSPAVLAEMGELQEIRMSSSDLSKLDAVTPTNPTLTGRIVNFQSLMTGSDDNAHNTDWVGTNSEFLRRQAGTTRSPQPLNEEIFHVNRNSRSEGVHWIPLRGDRNLVYEDAVPVPEAWTLWVRGADNTGPPQGGPGSVADPFTSLVQATGVATAGVYYFDLGGTAFSTYVDEQGFVQIALEYGQDANVALPQKTSLPPTSRGILTPAALASLTEMNEVRISSNVAGNLDARTTDPGIFNKILNNDALMTDSRDNAINKGWTGTGAQYLAGNADREQTTTNNLDRPLNEEIYHSFHGPGMHWIPYRGDQALQYNRDVRSVPPTEKYTLWVRAAQQSLPLLLHSFGAESVGHSVRIDWTIVSANGAEYIEIERSADAKQWETIDRREVAPGASFLGHRFDDMKPLRGTSYYRLRQTDYDGTVDLSYMVTVVRVDGADEVTAYPNPSSGQLTLSGVLYGDERIEIIDAVGRNVTASVSTISKDRDRLTLDVSRLATGIYYVRLGTRVCRVSKL